MSIVQDIECWTVQNNSIFRALCEQDGENKRRLCYTYAEDEDRFAMGCFVCLQIEVRRGWSSAQRTGGRVDTRTALTSPRTARRRGAAAKPPSARSPLAARTSARHPRRRSTRACPARTYTT
ncbi:hypothetical protein O0L34_g5114 [Tuta absoluta]|nr:hypothetical protein O0L34_g5114 [Tuta absoluta]